MPGLPFHHQLQKFTQTHVRWVGDAIQPSHPLSSPSPPALNLSRHQGLVQWVCPLHQVAKVLAMNLMNSTKRQKGMNTKNAIQMDLQAWTEWLPCPRWCDRYGNRSGFVGWVGGGSETADVLIFQRSCGLCSDNPCSPVLRVQANSNNTGYVPDEHLCSDMLVWLSRARGCVVWRFRVVTIKF